MEVRLPWLSRWGVSAKADLIYRALAMYGPQSSVDLARSLALDSTAVALALDELCDLGAAWIKEAGKRPEDRVWQGCSPKTVTAVVMAHRATTAKACIRMERQLSFLDILPTASMDWRAVRPIYGIPRARARLYELMAAERREHLAMNPEVIMSTAAVKAGIPAAIAVLQRGVATKTLGVPAKPDQDDPYSSELLTYGLEYKELPHQPIKLMIMDRKSAFLPLQPDVHFGHGVLEVTDPVAIDRFVAFFMDRWGKASQPRQPWLLPLELSARERAVLAALASSGTNYAAAKTLGISVRTLAYTLNDIMERYGVSTKFQLGVVLARLSSRAVSQEESMP